MSDDLGVWSYRARNPVVKSDTEATFTLDLGFDMTRDVTVEYAEGGVHEEQHQYTAKWVSGVVEAHDGRWPFLLRVRKGEEPNEYEAYIEAANGENPTLPDGEDAVYSLRLSLRRSGGDD